MAKYFIRKCTAAITAAFLLSAMSTIDRHDATLQQPSQAALDLLQIENDEYRARIEYDAAVKRIEAERVEYEAALEAAMVARRATGDYGEVYD